MRFHTLALAGAAALTVLASGGVAQATAAHTDENGVCEVNEICLYWGDNLTGSLYDSYSWYPDLVGKRFVSGGPGQGSWVKNNAASVWNRLEGTHACVFYDEMYRGAVDKIEFGSANLTVTKNNNASVKWGNGGSPSC